MGRPVNMNPEEYAAEVVKQQQEQIRELEEQLSNQTPPAPDSPPLD